MKRYDTELPAFQTNVKHTTLTRVCCDLRRRQNALVLKKR